MEVRCIKCTRSFDLARKGSFDFIKCRQCGACYDIRARRDVLTDREAHRHAIRSLADSSKIDPATANAVLLGLLTLQQARELSARAARMSAARQEAAAEKQKSERIRARRRIAHERSRSQTVLVLTAMGLLAVSSGLGLYTRSVWDKEIARIRDVGVQSQLRKELRARAESESKASSSSGDSRREKRDTRLRRAKLSRDSQHRVTRVAASTAKGALIAYCNVHRQDRGCAPLELTTLNPPKIGARLGIFRDLADAGALRAVRIERDRRTRKWVVGNGRRPIDHFELKPNLVGKQRAPVKAHVPATTTRKQVDRSN